MNIKFNVNKDDFDQMMDDIGRMLTYVIIVHTLSYIIDNDGELFSEQILKKFLYITISMVIYNLVVRKIVVPTKN